MLKALFSSLWDTSVWSRYETDCMKRLGRKCFCLEEPRRRPGWRRGGLVHDWKRRREKLHKATRYVCLGSRRTPVRRSAASICSFFDSWMRFQTKGLRTIRAENRCWKPLARSAAREAGGRASGLESCARRNLPRVAQRQAEFVHAGGVAAAVEQVFHVELKAHFAALNERLIRGKHVGHGVGGQP